MREKKPKHARRRSRAAVALASAILVGLSVGIAHAQVDLYPDVEQHATQNDLDTDVTPIAKESDLWTLVHGAKYPETKVIEGSVTSFDTDLFAVSFQNRTIGLAGGSTCPTTPIQQGGESDAAFGQRVADCEGTEGAQALRVPALYRYHEPATEDPGWDRLSLPGSIQPGYVGAITWIDSERALIVGGTGAYPRREAPADGEDPTDPAKADEAGKARVWVYRRRSDEVEELDLSALTVDAPATAEAPGRAGMRGLTAVDCYEDPSPKFGEEKLELCFAGGLGQIWEWRDGHFNGERVDALSPSAELVNPQLFAYRVRDLEFSGYEPPMAVAVTSGCCGADQQDLVPRVLTYNDDVNHPRNGNSFLPPGYTRGPSRWSAQKLYPRTEPEWPDSIYSMLINKPVGNPAGSGPGAFSIVASPGGQASQEEPPSVIQAGQSQTNRRRTMLGTARLLAGSGDVACEEATRLSGAGSCGFSGPEKDRDGVPDWVAGELRSTYRAGVGARGLLVATALAATAEESVNANVGVFNLGVNDHPGNPFGVNRPTAEEIVEGWAPIDEEKLNAHIRSQHYLLPSYSVKAVEIVGAEEDGWMVGDHGAILRLSAEQLQTSEGASEPQPPRLGATRSNPLSERSPYGPEEELPASAGTVPALGGDTEALEEPRMLGMGAPGGAVVTDIVMSRDGSEGWAIGSEGSGPAFYRFDGTSWTRCDPIGIEGVIPPDPACKAMAPLSGFRDSSGTLRTVSLIDAARVPLENDSDPTNDNELEIVAIGGNYQGRETNGQSKPAIIRYSGGRWRFEEAAAMASLEPSGGTSHLGYLATACTAPSDCWLAEEGGAGETNATGQPANVPYIDLYRFNGERWIDCYAEPSPCGVPSTRDLQRHRNLKLQNFGGLTAAGDRVYLFGSRPVGQGDRVPMIIYRDRGGTWTDGTGSGGRGGGFDPAFGDPTTPERGWVESLTVAKGEDGYEGWAVGRFARREDSVTFDFNPSADVRPGPPRAALMRLDAGEANWQRARSPGPFEDHMLSGLGVDTPRPQPITSARLAVSYPSALDPDAGFVAQLSRGSSGGRIFGFDSARARFGMLDSARPQGNGIPHFLGEAHPDGTLQTMEADGQGGFWAAVSGYFFHYTASAPRPVFSEVPNPLGIRGVELRALDGAEDGSVWAATASDRLYRYERGLGWEEVRVPGWEPGQIITRASAADAIAVGPRGEGLVVGEGGRIGNLSRDGVVLDAAAGRSCALGDSAPCGTSRDLGAVAIAPDGAAIAAGERLALLWRPSGGDFSEAQRPPIGSSTTIEAVSYPTPVRAYLATDRGVIFRGDLSASGAWTWRSEAINPRGELLSADRQGAPIAVRAIAVDEEGHGYAVGDRGLVLERTEQHGWRRLPTLYPEDLTSVSLPEGEGDGVLIGGENGLVLTGSGSSLSLARPADFSGTGEVVGFAYMPGSTEGSVDAWAGIASSQGGGDDRLLRYRSDSDNPALDPDSRASALPDAPHQGTGEFSLAAFGKSDCDLPESRLCPAMSATTTTNEVISDRIVDELAELREAGKLDLAVLSGDATDAAGADGNGIVSVGQHGDSLSDPVLDGGQLKHAVYEELVVNEFEDEGVPLFGAIGGQDLTETYRCDTEGHCDTTKQVANAGENLSWREAFAGRAEPWGDGADALGREGAVGFEPAPGSEDNAVRIEDQEVDADGEGIVPNVRAGIGGASTHYALDASRDGEPIARIVFVDTSLRSLAASDPLQQPQEIGGQLRFLERMICRRGQTSSAGDPCTREPGQTAIVVSNTPAYSYGPGALTHTSTDASVFESLILRHDVDLVISGALGYNGLYYTLAPGIHEPCPGAEHPKAPPAGFPECASEASAATEALNEAGIPDPTKALEEQGLTGAYPTLISAGAGGKFGPDGQQGPEGPAGQWHGYSLARLMPTGEVVIEQRPILDWIGIDANEHTMQPRSTLELNGYGRSPISTGVTSQQPRAFHYEISNAAITHRYDLLLADPEEPWLPCEAADPACVGLYKRLAGTRSLGSATASGSGSARDDMGGASASSHMSSRAEASRSDAAAEGSRPGNACEPYLCLPERIATIDDQSGQVRAGNGKYPDTFAIAMLSVDEKVATWPLVFTRSPSFIVEPAALTAPIPTTPGVAPSPPQPPSPPNPPNPQIPQVSTPEIPALPGTPPLAAAQAPEPRPPAPPAPPPPTEQPSPLSLTLAPPGVTIATPTAVIQPPTPPVNPAPPGGARREARQRQAAAQKSGADSDQEEGGSSDSQQMWDGANSPPSTEGTRMVRRDRTKPEPSITALSRADQPSAWAQGSLYGGGITLAAAILALAWSGVRPTPRRRPPEVPAPAQAWARRH